MKEISDLKMELPVQAQGQQWSDLLEHPTQFLQKRLAPLALLEATTLGKYVTQPWMS